MTRVRGNRDAEVSGKIIEEAGDLAKCVETQTKKNFVHRRRGEKKKKTLESQCARGQKISPKRRERGRVECVVRVGC